LAATLYFNRLAQRVTAALSAPTAAGPLYEVDTRLRPSGSQGLLAVSIDSFDQYQRENAWTWEHMALARARIVHGTAEDRAAIGAIIDMALHQVRDPGQLVDDVVKMRSEISTHKPPAGSLDVKLIEGGLVDLEFVVHHLQLRTRTGLSPFLGEAVSGLVAAGLAPAGLRAAHDLMTRFLVTMRLVAPTAAEARDLTPDVQALVARAAGCGDWASLMRDYDQARALVSTLWAEQTGDKRNG
jgi:glutamate-ammonia-ligase adenylyltransferase